MLSRIAQWLTGHDLTLPPDVLRSQERLEACRQREAEAFERLQQDRVRAQEQYARRLTEPECLLRREDDTSSTFNDPAAHPAA